MFQEQRGDCTCTEHGAFSPLSLFSKQYTYLHSIYIVSDIGNLEDLNVQEDVCGLDSNSTALCTRSCASVAPGGWYLSSALVRHQGVTLLEPWQEVGTGLAGGLQGGGDLNLAFPGGG